MLHSSGSKDLTVTQMLSRFGRNESGATAIEYGLIAAVMSVAILAAFPLLRTAIETAFGAISTAMTTAK